MWVTKDQFDAGFEDQLYKDMKTLGRQSVAVPEGGVAGARDFGGGLAYTA